MTKLAGLRNALIHECDKLLASQGISCNKIVTTCYGESYAVHINSAERCAVVTAAQQALRGKRGPDNTKARKMLREARILTRVIELLETGNELKELARDEEIQKRNDAIRRKEESANPTSVLNRPLWLSLQMMKDEATE